MNPRDSVLLAIELITGTRRLDILSQRRMRPTALHRQIGMWTAARTTSASLITIGRWFGRDHSTVLHAIRTIDQRVRDDRDVGLTAWRVLHRAQLLMATQPPDYDPAQQRLALT